MRIQPILVATLATCAFAKLHGTAPVHTVLIEQSQPETESHLNTRDAPNNLDYRCGPKIGKCPVGTCCSGSGFCGTSKAHCRSPDCKIDYGKCDAHRSPDGPPTKEIPRPHIGQVPYGPREIRSCAIPGTVALTFDDGPTRYTGDLLDLLDKYDAKATFFITGINNGKGPIDDLSLPWASLIERMHSSGHQIASHTWSHEDLSKITPTQRNEQIEKNEAALRNILGQFPTYMRPPYSSCNPDTECGNDLGQLGYHIILYDIDTDDYKNDSPDLIQRSKDIFDHQLLYSDPRTKSWLVIAHDAHEQTVHNLTEHMLKGIKRQGYRAITVGDCLRDPRPLWYRKDSRMPTHKKKPKKTASSADPNKPISWDGSCGSNYTCLGSTYGFCCGSTNSCGNTTSHCGNGCQKDAGYCAVEAPYNGDAWDPKVETKSHKSEADSDFRTIGTAAATSLFLALIVAMWM
ncbi:hypothetical protein N7449_006369 [Penicillium cf. viridicatum]|uniref:Chitin deacetylase n=1 Tax=Penicillium cf. viridicatum TaxID=2972119 RepID=A0A9W9JFE2_9EURO|nr:hypothetical protein N7449_006369 [Penicillium cf. viridicatum]